MPVKSGTVGSVSPPYSQPGFAPKARVKSAALRAHHSLAFAGSVIPGGNVTVRLPDVTFQPASDTVEGSGL